MCFIIKSSWKGLNWSIILNPQITFQHIQQGQALATVMVAKAIASLLVKTHDLNLAPQAFDDLLHSFGLASVHQCGGFNIPFSHYFAPSGLSFGTKDVQNLVQSVSWLIGCQSLSSNPWHCGA